MRPLRNFALRNYITLGLSAIALIAFLASGLRPAAGSLYVSPISGDETRLQPALPMQPALQKSDATALTSIPGVGASGEKRSNPLSLKLLPASFASPFATTLTATKTDNLAPSATVNPGDTIMYTVTITNTGAMDATNVMFTDTIDPNTTLVAGSVKSSPIAFNDTYTASGNIPIALAAGTGVLANDIDPDTGNNTGLTVTQVQGAAGNVGNPTNTTATGIGGVNGSVTVQANGSFTYEPPPGFTGADTFTYQISDASGKTGSGTVTINITNMVWFIDNTAAASLNRGTFSQPFKTIAAFNLINTGAPPNAQNGNHVVLRPAGGTYAEADGINLRDSQTLTGSAVAFNSVFVADSNSTSAYTTFAASTGAAPTITATAGDGVDLGSGNALRGFNVGNTPLGFGFNGTAVGSLIVATVSKTGTGGAINVSTSGAFGSNVTFGTLDSASSTAQGINLVGVTGTLGVTNAGAGISAPTGDAVHVNGGTVTLSYPGNITKNNAGSVVKVEGGHTTGTLTFPGTLSATTASAGNGLQFDNADGTYNFSGTTTLNGGDAGVDILNGSGGTFSFSSSTTITSPTGTAFNVNTGSPAVTYSGSITQNTSGQRVINIDSTTGNTITFNTGTITGGASSTGVNINAANSNVTFSNGMTMGTSGSRMTNQAVTITGGNGTYSLGAVSVFTNNAAGIVATNADGTINSSGVVNSTNATAIDINGPAGLTSLSMSFTSVNSTGGAADGISIQDTTGSFTVTGSGSAASGGTISGKTGADSSTSSGIGVFLNNVTNISLTRMDIEGCQNYGIRGNNVTGFTLDNSTVGATSINGTNNTADVDPTGYSSEGSIRFYNLLGSATISNSTIDLGFGKTIAVANDTGTLNRLTVTNCTVRNNQPASTVADSFYAQASGSAILNFTVNGASVFNAVRGFHITTSAQATSTMDILINGGCAFSNTINPLPAGGGLQFGSSGTDSLVTLTINGNSFRHGTGGSPPGVNNVGRLITCGSVSGNSKFDGKITNNTFGVTGIARSGAGDGADAIGIFASGNKAGTTRGTGTLDSRFLVQNNIIKRYGEAGILINARQGNSILDATVFGNTINEPGTAALGAFAAIWVNAGALPTDTSTVNVVIGDASVAANKNTMQDSDPSNATDVFLDKNTCAGCGSALNLFRNGSGAGAGQSEAIDKQILIDDNNPTLDLGVGFTNGSGPTIGTPGGAPMQPLSVIPGGKSTSGSGVPLPGEGVDKIDILRDTKGGNPNRENVTKLSQAELNWMVQAAIARWVETGISAEDLARMQAVTFEVAALTDNQLASADGDHVKIEETGAGYGWYFDQSPSEDGEFQVEVPDKELQSGYLSPARGKVDLLTVVMRQLGQVYLQDKKRTPQILRPLMEKTLSPGVRRLPLGQWRITPPSSTVGQASLAPGNGTRSEIAAADQSSAPYAGKPAVAQAKNTENAFASVPATGGRIPAEARHAVFNPATDKRTAAGAVMKFNSASDARAYAAIRARRVGSAAPFSGETVNVGPFTLPVGKSVTIMFNVTVDSLGSLPVGKSQVCNQGFVSATGIPSFGTDDTDLPGGAADPTCTKLNVADLAVTKSDTPDPVIAGSNITYTVNFVNNGPASASTVTVTDAVPANTTFVSAVVTTGAGWTIPSPPAVGGTGNIVFSKGTVASLETAVFTIVVKVTDTTPHLTVITNSVTAASTTSDTTPANNTASTTTTVTGKADLTMTKTASPTPDVVAGNDITYTLNFSNAGPGTAVNVLVSDAVPANTTLVSAVVTTGTGWTRSDSVPAGGTGTITFTKASVASGETAVFTIVVNVAGSVTPGTIITNTATATAATSDPTPATSTTNTNVIAQADLAVTKTDSPDPVTAGNNITYTINFVNNGPGTAQTVTVTDAVPTNTTFVSAVVTTGTGWTIPSPPAVGGTGNVVFAKGSVPNGETAVFTIVVKVNANTPSGTTISNSATAASTTSDPTPGNNTGSATTTVQTRVDLAVTKSDTPDPVIAGNNITYTINFTNNGPSDAQTVTVTDAVPANTTLVSAVVSTGSGWSVSTAGPIVFSKGTVTPLETAVFTIIVNVNTNTPNGTTITNTATTATTTTDTNPPNDSATATTTVQTQANLIVTKSDSPDPVAAGNNLTYTVTFTNGGPSDAQMVTVTDAVPANTTFVSAVVTTGGGWIPTTPAVGGTGNIVFAKPTVAFGEGAVFTIIVNVNSNTANGTTITNSAVAASATTDPTPGNNTGTATTTVNAQADLAVTKTDTPDPAFTGTNITYTINFVNNGPSDAQTVTVTDAVPTNTTFVSATVTTGTGWTVSSPAVGGTGNIVFSKATVASEEAAVFTVVVKVDLATPVGTIVTNSATAASTTTDPTPGNNTGTATTTISAQADLSVTKSDSPDPVLAGNTITYTVNFANAGPGAANTVTVTDAVPANATFVSAVVTTGTGWSIVMPSVGGTGNVVFSKASVAPAESAVFTIVVKVNANTPNGTTITNSAVAASTTADPVPSNNTGTATTTVNTQADVAVTKTDTPDPVLAGANITYTINFVNNGPSDAQNVVVTDNTPAGTTLVSAVVTTGSGWSVGGATTFSKATVAAGETAVFTIVVKVPSSTTAGTVINNQATVTTDTPDPSSGNNTSSTTTTVNVQADLQVTKTDSPDPVIAGNNLTYTINFANVGPSDAQTVAVSDAVPAGTTLVSAVVTTGGGWSTSLAGPIVFSKGTVTAGEMAVFTIVVTVNPNTAAGTVITNSATATSATTDPTPGNNTGTATTTVAAQADLAVTKTDTPDPVNAGSNITYTVSFVNSGPSFAQTVTLTDAVPANTTFVSAVVTTGTGWTLSSPAVGGTGNIVFSKSPVANGETATFTIIVKVNSNTAAGTITNSATAASTTTDPIPANNTGTATTTVQVLSDVSITKTDSPDPVLAGNNLTYTINLVNNGPSDATSVSVSDPIPAGTTLVSVTTPAGWSRTDSTPVGGTGTITFTKATVINGETAVFTIVVKVGANVANGTTITNTATVTSTSPDGTAGNNTSTTTTAVQTQADLLVTKTDSPDPVTAGTNLTYTINFTNNGPSDAQTVTITDAVPAGTTFVSGVVTTGTGWTVTSPAVGTTGNVVFSKGTVAAGETAVFTIVVNVNANVANGTTITNSAVAASTTTDPTPANNTGTATTTVQTRADLSVTKSDSPDPVFAGANLTYTINFSNLGASDAQTVTVTDAVPANTTFVSAVVTTGTGWTVTAPAVGGTGNVVFSKGTVAAGESAVFTMVVKVNSGLSSGSTIGNSATAASTTTDPTPSNNTGTATTTVQVQADLVVTKTDSPDPVVASQNLTYTINFVNNGPSNAVTVSLSDALPANTTFVSTTTPAGWTRTDSTAVGGTGTIAFIKSTVTPGETAVVTIVVNVNINTPNNTVITNSATATSPTPDPTPANNTGTATTTVIAQADLAVTKTDAPDPACVNGNITYTINLIDNGPGPGINTTVTDPVPANTTFVSASVTSGTGWSTSSPAVGGTGNVVFSKASVANGETATFQMVVKVNSGTVHGTVIDNSVVAASSIPDPNGANNTAMASTTVDPIAPIFTGGCPAAVSSAAQASCPFASAGTVNYTPPSASDNCPGVTVVCVPPSGSMFPTGTTTVTCTATDTAGNTATCSFPVTVFSLCVQDNSNPGNVVLVDATTGAYRFCCNGTLVASGTGTLNVRGCTVTINDSANNKIVLITVDGASMKGTASVKQGGTILCTITDKNLANNSCVCQ